MILHSMVCDGEESGGGGCPFNRTCKIWYAVDGVILLTTIAVVVLWKMGMLGA